MGGERVLVKFLDNERASTPTIINNFGKCLTLPAAILRHLTGSSELSVGGDSAPNAKASITSRTADVHGRC